MDKTKRQEFIKAIYVKNIKNTYSTIYTALGLFAEYKDEQIYTQIKHFLEQGIPQLNQIYRDNLARIKKALKDYNKDLSEMTEYKIISAFWTEHLPNLMKHLEDINSAIQNLGFNEKTKDLLIKTFKNMWIGAKLLNELQKVLYGEGLISHEDRKTLDGMG